MKRVVATWALALLSSLALALPAPKDIDAAVKAGNLPQAETLLHEVIKEKPGSAKAHYELGQVLAREGRSGEARGELLEAQRIDPSLKFAKDPQHFRDLLNRLPAATPAAPAMKSAQPVPANPMAAAAGTGFPWAYIALGGAALALIWFFVRRATAAAAPRLPMGAAPAAGPAGTAGYGYGGYGASSPYGAAPQAPGSGVGGAVLGGLAGLAAGYGLAKVLENEHEDHRPAQSADSNGFIPIDSPAQADYGDFDMGSGNDDSWDAGDASGGDDNW